MVLVRRRIGSTVGERTAESAVYECLAEGELRLHRPRRYLARIARARSAPTFDGAGGFVLSATSSFKGILQPATVKGTYSVNPDCTYTSQAENGVTFRAVIVDDGAQLLILQTTPGVVITGIADVQDRSVAPDVRTRRCAAALTEGSYGFLAEGFAGPPTIPGNLAGPLAGVGTVAFDPAGKCTIAPVKVKPTSKFILSVQSVPTT